MRFCSSLEDKGAGPVHHWLRGFQALGGRHEHQRRRAIGLPLTSQMLQCQLSDVTYMVDCRRCDANTYMTDMGSTAEVRRISSGHGRPASAIGQKRSLRFGWRASAIQRRSDAASSLLALRNYHCLYRIVHAACSHRAFSLLHPHPSLQMLLAVQELYFEETNSQIYLRHKGIAKRSPHSHQILPKIRTF